MPKPPLFPKILSLFLGAFLSTQNAFASYALAEKQGVSLSINIPASLGSIRLASQVPSHQGLTVLHFQDIHQNKEAQLNMGKALKFLMDQKKVDLVALEGISGPLNLKPHQTFFDRKAIKVVADYLLRENRISGPVYQGFLQTKNAPPFVGIEDPDLYAQNVSALKEALPQKDEKLKNLHQQELSLNQRFEKEANSLLNRFDRLVMDFEYKEVSPIEFSEFLSQFSENKILKQFLDLARLEENLHLSQIEKERNQLIEILLRSAESKVKPLFWQKTKQFRDGKVGPASYYRFLKKTALERNLGWSSFSHLAEYESYLHQTEAFDPISLLNSIQTVQHDLFMKWAHTETEKELVENRLFLILAKKLVSLSLSKSEWTAYKEVRRDGLEDFEKFYHMAILRDQAMAARFADAIRATGAKQPVLVTGGFHASGIKTFSSPRLQFVSFVPKVSKIESETGPVYLSSFMQEKTPLDLLFEGDRLFLAQKPLRISNVTVGLLLIPTLSHLYNKYKTTSTDWMRAVLQRFDSKVMSLPMRLHREGKTFFFMVGSRSLSFQFDKGPSLVKVQWGEKPNNPFQNGISWDYRYALLGGLLWALSWWMDSSLSDVFILSMVPSAVPPEPELNEISIPFYDQKIPIAVTPKAFKFIEYHRGRVSFDEAKELVEDYGGNPSSQKNRKNFFWLLEHLYNFSISEVAWENRNNTRDKLASFFEFEMNWDAWEMEKEDKAYFLGFLLIYLLVLEYKLTHGSKRNKKDKDFQLSLITQVQKMAIRKAESLGDSSIFEQNVSDALKVFITKILDKQTGEKLSSLAKELTTKRWDNATLLEDTRDSGSARRSKSERLMEEMGLSPKEKPLIQKLFDALIPEPRENEPDHDFEERRRAYSYPLAHLEKKAEKSQWLIYEPDSDVGEFSLDFQYAFFEKVVQKGYKKLALDLTNLVMRLSPALRNGGHEKSFPEIFSAVETYLDPIEKRKLFEILEIPPEVEFNDLVLWTLTFLMKLKRLMNENEVEFMLIHESNSKSPKKAQLIRFLDLLPSEASNMEEKVVIFSSERGLLNELIQLTTDKPHQIRHRIGKDFLHEKTPNSFFQFTGKKVGDLRYWPPDNFTIGFYLEKNSAVPEAFRDASKNTQEYYRDQFQKEVDAFILTSEFRGERTDLDSQFVQPTVNPFSYSPNSGPTEGDFSPVPTGGGYSPYGLGAKERTWAVYPQSISNIYTWILGMMVIFFYLNGVEDIGSERLKLIIAYSVLIVPVSYALTLYSGISVFFLVLFIGLLSTFGILWTYEFGFPFSEYANERLRDFGGFFILLYVLTFAHELGHKLGARLFGERASIVVPNLSWKTWWKPNALYGIGVKTEPGKSDVEIFTIAFWGFLTNVLSFIFGGAIMFHSPFFHDLFGVVIPNEYYRWVGFSLISYALYSTPHNITDLKALLLRQEPKDGFYPAGRQVVVERDPVEREIWAILFDRDNTLLEEDGDFPKEFRFKFKGLIQSRSKLLYGIISMGEIRTTLRLVNRNLHPVVQERIYTYGTMGDYSLEMTGYSPAQPRDDLAPSLILRNEFSDFRTAKLLPLDDFLRRVAVHRGLLSSGDDITDSLKKEVASHVLAFGDDPETDQSWLNVIAENGGLAYLVKHRTLPEGFHAKVTALEGRGPQEIFGKLKKLGRYFQMNRVQEEEEEPGAPVSGSSPRPINRTQAIGKAREISDFVQKQSPAKQGKRARLLSGEDSYDGWVKNHFPANILPKLKEGLLPLMEQKEEESKKKKTKWVWLDGAAGIGWAGKEAQKRFKRIWVLTNDVVRWEKTHFENSQGMEERARKNGIRLPWLKNNNNFFISDLHTQQIAHVEGRSNQLITVFDSLHLFEDPLGVLVHLYNQLDEGGVLLADLQFMGGTIDRDEKLAFWREHLRFLKKHLMKVDYRVEKNLLTIVMVKTEGDLVSHFSLDPIEENQGNIVPYIQRSRAGYTSHGEEPFAFPMVHHEETVLIHHALNALDETDVVKNGLIIRELKMILRESGQRIPFDLDGTQGSFRGIDPKAIQSLIPELQKQARVHFRQFLKNPDILLFRMRFRESMRKVLVAEEGLRILLSGGKVGESRWLPREKKVADFDYRIFINRIRYLFEMKIFKRGMTVVDAPSGQGWSTHAFRRLLGKEGKVFAIEPNPDAAEYMNHLPVGEAEMASTEHFGMAPFEVKQNSIFDMPLEDGLVDVVFSNQVLNKIFDRKRFFDEVKRILKPKGGRLIVVAAQYSSLQDSLKDGSRRPTHIFQFDRQMMEQELTKNGFTLVGLFRQRVDHSGSFSGMARLPLDPSAPIYLQTDPSDDYYLIAEAIPRLPKEEKTKGSTFPWWKLGRLFRIVGFSVMVIFAIWGGPALNSEGVLAFGWAPLHFLPKPEKRGVGDVFGPVEAALKKNRKGLKSLKMNDFITLGQARQWRNGA